MSHPSRVPPLSSAPSNALTSHSLLGPLTLVLHARPWGAEEACCSCGEPLGKPGARRQRLGRLPGGHEQGHALEPAELQGGVAAHNSSKRSCPSLRIVTQHNAIPFSSNQLPCTRSSDLCWRPLTACILPVSWRPVCAEQRLFPF
jgi:hypothetical protein